MQITPCNNNQQSFGMAIKADKRTMALLERRLNPGEWTELNDLVVAQRENPVNVLLSNLDKKGKITATITDGENFTEQATESGFRLFSRSPFKFIKRQAGRADELNEARESMQAAKSAILDEMA